MPKWDYIRKISACGDRYGNKGGIHDLLDWCQKSCTLDVSESEARLFYELISVIKYTEENQKQIKSKK
ncbi:MAG: hypothetical protein GX025_03650 [Clostridiales bacterium]|nr:hypothetical protein [Clostridiales bacterium]